MTNQSKKEICCPFWDKFEKRTCRMVESGLFIPTHEHILHFCENEQYISCYHYTGKRLLEPTGLIDEVTEKPIKNRRIYTRIPTSQKLSISRYSMAKEEDEEIIDDQAMMVDLGLGGMRIETSASVHENQIISFSFDEHFHPPGFKGKGEIRWLVPPDFRQGESTNAGLAFVDDVTKDTVRNHLLGMGEKLLRLSGF